MHHTRLINSWNNRLEEGSVVFSNEILNQVFDSSILKYKAPVGATLRQQRDPEFMYKSIMKKVTRYKYEEWRSKINCNMRSTEGRAKSKEFFKTFRVSIFDFSYQMRIRSNYRDFAFIDEITSDDTEKYFIEYFNFSQNIQIALATLIKQIRKERLK